MTEENKVRDVVDAVAGVAKAVPVYQDVVQPAAQEIGKGLQTVAKTVHIVLAPVSALVWGYDQIKDFVSTKVADRLKSVPPENIVTPRPNVAGPALEALRYTGHETSLSDLYANLLASAMDKSTAQGAHPAFVEIIKQLTPDEAKLVSLFAVDQPLPLIDLHWKYKPNSEGQSGGKPALTNFSHLGSMAGCEFSDLVPSCIDNVCRLGLAEIPAFGSYTDKSIYAPLRSDPLVLAHIAEIESHSNLQSNIDEKYLRVTELGKQFARVCVVPKC